MASYHLSVKVGAKGKALPHASYIAREGDYKTRQGEKLEATAHGNMPEWAQKNPSLFWQCADEYERKNGSTYREIEIALPRELSSEQRKDLVQDFVNQELGNKHAYTWAIHTPKASIEGGEQPHVHIMFSERIQDGIHRSPDQFFKRYNSKQPERGGCQKSNIAKSAEQRKNELVALRERFANLQNAYLEKYGHESRVDHRSLDDQGIERSPEKHLGWKGSRNPQFKALVLEYREATQTLDAYLKYLPKHFEQIDQQKAQQKPQWTEEQKQQFIDQTLTEANNICAEYKTLFEKHRSQYIEQIIQTELNRYKAQGADIRSKIEKLDQNKPMLFGRDEWSEKRENLVQDYRQIQALYDQTKTQKKTEYLDDQRFGRKQITQYIEKNHPELSRDYAQAKDLLTKVAQFKQEQYLKERMQHKEKSKGRDLER